MLVTGIIVLGVAVYAVWAVRKIYGGSLWEMNGAVLQIYLLT